MCTIGWSCIVICYWHCEVFTIFSSLIYSFLMCICSNYTIKCAIRCKEEVIKRKVAASEDVTEEVTFGDLGMTLFFLITLYRSRFSFLVSSFLFLVSRFLIFSLLGPRFFSIFSFLGRFPFHFSSFSRSSFLIFCNRTLYSWKDRRDYSQFC